MMRFGFFGDASSVTSSDEGALPSSSANILIEYELKPIKNIKDKNILNSLDSFFICVVSLNSRKFYPRKKLTGSISL